MQNNWHLVSIKTCWRWSFCCSSCCSCRRTTVTNDSGGLWTVTVFFVIMRTIVKRSFTSTAVDFVVGEFIWSYSKVRSCIDISSSAITKLTANNIGLHGRNNWQLLWAKICIVYNWFNETNISILKWLVMNSRGINGPPNSVFPNLFWFAAPLLSHEGICRNPMWFNRSKVRGIVTIGGIPGTSLRYPCMPRYPDWEPLAFKTFFSLLHFKNSVKRWER